MKAKISEKYSRIIEAGVNVFTRKGFYKATVEEVAREAGVGKGTVYTYFQNKEALFEAIIEEGIKEMARVVEETRNPQDDPRRQLKKAIFSILDFFSKHRDFCIFLVREHFGYNQSIKEQAEKFHSRYNSIFNTILQQGREKGIFKFEHLDTLSFGLTGAVFSAAFYWFLFADEFPMQKIYQTIEDLFFNNLLGD